MYWLRVLQTEKGTFPTVKTEPLPISCFHCKNAPCVQVCPTGAMHKRDEDGVVLIDYQKCIGCRYCINACPYGNVTFDPVAHIAKKCTLCVDRVYDQKLPEYERIPACVRSCPSGARVFGDIDDPESRVSQIIAEYGAFQIGPEFGTEPSNQYLPFRGPGGPNGSWPYKTRREDFAERTGAVDVISAKVNGAKQLGGGNGA